MNALVSSTKAAARSAAAHRAWATRRRRRAGEAPDARPVVLAAAALGPLIPAEDIPKCVAGSFGPEASALQELDAALRAVDRALNAHDGGPEVTREVLRARAPALFPLVAGVTEATATLGAFLGLVDALDPHLLSRAFLRDEQEAGRKGTWGRGPSRPGPGRARERAGMTRCVGRFFRPRSCK